MRNHLIVFTDYNVLRLYIGSLCDKLRENMEYPIHIIHRNTVRTKEDTYLCVIVKNFDDTIKLLGMIFDTINYYQFIDQKLIDKINQRLKGYKGVRTYE